MCGRFSLSTSKSILDEYFDWVDIPDFSSRYNIAPSQSVQSIIHANDTFRAGKLRWGLVPFWSKADKLPAGSINARAESLTEKPSFRHTLTSKRCLILADGFYEWRKADTGKIPTYIFRPSHRPFTFAGIYDKWTDPNGETHFTCAIITTQASQSIRDIHARMPVILTEGADRAWLTREKDHALELRTPFNDLDFHAVSTHVNNPAHDDANCIAAVRDE